MQRSLQVVKAAENTAGCQGYRDHCRLSRLQRSLQVVKAKLYSVVSTDGNQLKLQFVLVDKISYIFLDKIQTQ